MCRCRPEVGVAGDCVQQCRVEGCRRGSETSQEGRRGGRGRKTAALLLPKRGAAFLYTPYRSAHRSGWERGAEEGEGKTWQSSSRMPPPPELLPSSRVPAKRWAERRQTAAPEITDYDASHIHRCLDRPARAVNDHFAMTVVGQCVGILLACTQGWGRAQVDLPKCAFSYTKQTITLANN